MRNWKNTTAIQQPVALKTPLQPGTVVKEETELVSSWKLLTNGF